MLADFQRELIVANTHDVLAVAHAGRNGGRRPKLTAEQVALIQQLYDLAVMIVQRIADLFGVSRSTSYGHLDKNTVGTRPRAARRG